VKISKADQVADVLRREIALGVYPTGADLPSEARLSARFGVSRPSSREALRVLESEGLIKVTRGARGGAKILAPPIETISRYLGVYLQMRGVKLAELYAAMQAFEPLAVRAIATRRDPAALSALAQCVARQEFSTHDPDAFKANEAEFRRLLMQHSGNEVIHMMGELLADVYDLTMANVRSEIRAQDTDSDDRASGVSAMRRLVKLMAEGEAAKAEQAWTAYLAVYWRKVARHVGEDKRINVYAGDEAQEHDPAPSASLAEPKRRGRSALG
jgi:DNA-binding FadR family transcriptional regulator